MRTVSSEPFLFTEKAPAQHGETVFVGDRAVGTVGNFSGLVYRAGKNLATAYVMPEFSGVRAELSVILLSKHYGAVVAEDCLYDSTRNRQVCI